MAIVIQSPWKYVQGPHVFENLGEYARTYGDNYLILTSKTPLKFFKEKIEKSFQECNIKGTFEVFNGQCTLKEIARVEELVKENGYNAIIGLGGGKVLDVSRCVAGNLKLPLVIAPTIASTDAPTSSDSVVYNEDGTVAFAPVYPHNPHLVIVDSHVIANAPVRMLVAGMGDALATYFEARVCAEMNSPSTLGHGLSVAALALARACYDTLMEHGYKAKIANANKKVTPSLEKIIEANTYLSGIGFESGGLSLCHAMHDALTAIPECHKFLHGEKVAFGAVTMLVMENRPQEEIEKTLAFCASVGLPITLAQLDITENVEEKLRKVIHIAVPKDHALYRIPPGITEDAAVGAVLVTDQLGRDFLAKQK